MDGFLKMSRFAGMREDLVQASGGNSSYKATPEEMYIKASGVQLADVTKEDGYGVVNPGIIREAFGDMQKIDGLTEKDGKEILRRALIRGQRPSIETFLHAISGRYTLHTHPVVVNVLTCRKGGMEILESLFPEALTVPYGTPGMELAKKYFKAYKGMKADSWTSGVVFLRNHGLVVSSETVEEVIEKTEYVVERIEAYLGCDFKAYHKATEIWGYFPEMVVWKVTDQRVTSFYNETGEAWEHAFCPDCVVFLGKKALILENDGWDKTIKEFRMAHGEPVIVLYKDNVYILADSVRKATEIQSVLGFSAKVTELNKGQECFFLSDTEQNLLLDWDAEKYRRNK